MDAFNIFGTSQGVSKPAIKKGKLRVKGSRKYLYAEPWKVTVNGKGVGTYRTRVEAEKAAKRQRRVDKKRGAVKVVKR